jgi:hypothetical protein
MRNMLKEQTNSCIVKEDPPIYQKTNPNLMRRQPLRKVSKNGKKTQKISYKIETTSFIPDQNTGYFIGIDPGTNNGVAIYNTHIKRFIFAKTFCWWDTIAFFDTLNCSYEIIIEDIIANKITFKRNMIWGALSKKNTKSIALAIAIFDKFAQDIGGNKRDEQHLLDYFERKHIVTHRLVPKKNSKTKLSAKQLEHEFGITGRTSSHSRDAITLVLSYLNKTMN